MRKFLKQRIVFVSTISLALGFFSIVSGVTLFEPTALFAASSSGSAGEVWRNLDDNTKAGFVWGWSQAYKCGVEGFALRVNMAETERQSWRKTFSLIQNTQLDVWISGMNEFYSNFRNAEIPPGLAMLVVAKQLNGDRNVNVEEQIQNFRKQIQELRRASTR